MPRKLIIKKPKDKRKKARISNNVEINIIDSSRPRTRRNPKLDRKISEMKPMNIPITPAVPNVLSQEQYDLLRQKLEQKEQEKQTEVKIATLTQQQQNQSQQQQQLQKQITELNTTISNNNQINIYNDLKEKISEHKEIERKIKDEDDPIKREELEEQLRISKRENELLKEDAIATLEKHRKSLEDPEIYAQPIQKLREIAHDNVVDDDDLGRKLEVTLNAYFEEYLNNKNRADSSTFEIFLRTYKQLEDDIRRNRFDEKPQIRIKLEKLFDKPPKRLNKPMVSRRSIINWIAKVEDLYDQIENIEGRGLISLPKLSADRPKSFNQLIDKYGDWTITKIRIVRKALLPLLEKLANIVTLGNFEKKKKEININKYFHLFLEIAIRSPEGTNNVILLEKNQRASWKDHVSGGLSSGEEAMDVPLRGKTLSLRKFIENGEDFNKKRKSSCSLYIYDAVNCNCQIYVKDMINGSGLWTSTMNDFTVQDVGHSVPSVLAKFLRKVTDTAHRIDVAKSGGQNFNMYRYKGINNK